MTNEDGLDEDIARELRAAGRDQDEGAVNQAVQQVASSHAGRPIDEIESVLRQTIRDVTGDGVLLSPEAVHGAARRISESAPHA